MDSMSLEVLENIQETAVKADGANGKVQIVAAPQLGAGKCLIISANGSYEIKDNEAPRHHVLGNVQAVIDWVKYAAKTLAATPVIWVHTRTIRVVLDDKDSKLPRPVIVYELKETAEYQLLQKLAVAPKCFEQKEFIRMLRNQLWDCLDQAADKDDRSLTTREALIKKLRTLNFAAGMSGKSTISGSRESLGLDIENEVTSAIGALPEELHLQVRLFQDGALAARQKVTSDLEVTVGTKPAFCLTPLTSDLDEALENEIEALFQFFRTKLPETSIFRGVYQGKGEGVTA